MTLHVDDVLWRRPDADRPAPQVFSWRVFGWKFSDHDVTKRVEMAGEGKPRIESGHTYIIAIQWEAAICEPGDVPVPGMWRGLGADATLPFDEGVIGQGEYEGAYRSAAQARDDAAQPGGVDYTFEAQMTGHDAHVLRAALHEAKPADREDFGKAPARCD